MYVTFNFPDGFNPLSFVSKMIEHLPGSRIWRGGTEIWIPRATRKEQVAESVRLAVKALKLKGKRPSYQLLGELFGV